MIYTHVDSRLYRYTYIDYIIRYVCKSILGCIVCVFTEGCSNHLPWLHHIRCASRKNATENPWTCQWTSFPVFLPVNFRCLRILEPSHGQISEGLPLMSWFFLDVNSPFRSSHSGWFNPYFRWTLHVRHHRFCDSPAFQQIL